MLLSKIVELWDSILYCIYNLFAFIIYLIRYPKIKYIIAKNRELFNKHKGQRCFIVLNGPSINKYDLSCLENEIVFVSNYMFKSDLVKKIKPNYYCWLDSKDLISDKWKNLQCEIKEKCQNTKLIINIKGYKTTEDHESVYYTYNKLKAHAWGIWGNINSISSAFFTVAWYAINIAIYMGFSDIYILGLDFEPGAFTLFTDLSVKDLDVSKELKKEVVCGDYWQYAQAHYESYILEKHARKKGCRIVNLNKNSHIRAFQFGNFEDLF